MYERISKWMYESWLVESTTLVQLLQLLGHFLESSHSLWKISLHWCAIQHFIHYAIVLVKVNKKKYKDNWDVEVASYEQKWNKYVIVTNLL